MVKSLEKLTAIGFNFRRAMRKIFGNRNKFSGSKDYWISRYSSGGNSGDGSYQHLAEFKAEILNDFVRVKNIKTVIEFGCGDGNQLTLSRYPSYVGFDVSPVALRQCRTLFSNDKSKEFKLVSEYAQERADLALSLDVIYHLVENEIFERYMERLFDASNEFVIIYSSDSDGLAEKTAAHVRHRKFSNWIMNKRPSWELLEKVKNRYPYDGNTKTGSFADFYFYQIKKST